VRNLLGEQVTLELFAAVEAQLLQLLLGFDALGHYPESKVARYLDNRCLGPLPSEKRTISAHWLSGVSNLDPEQTSHQSESILGHM